MVLLAIPVAHHAALRAVGTGVCCYATSMADQMISYVEAQCKGQPDSAVDVLRSGLSMPGISAVDAARLHLTLGHIEADRHNWAEVHGHSSSSLKLLHSDSAGAAASSAEATALNYASGFLGVQALMLEGHDEQAHGLAGTCEHVLRSSPAPHARGLALDVVARIAAGREDALDAAEQLRGELAALGSSPSGAELADAQLALGLWQACSADEDGAAEASFTAAAAAAASAAGSQQPAAAGPGSAAQPGPSSSPPSPAAAVLLGLRHPHHLHEVEADALLGAAQLAVRARQWDKAEPLLERSLKAAEAAHGEQSPGLAPALALLAFTYSRSARVTFAEGLYREAAKMLKLDPNRLQGLTPKCPAQHPSMTAVLAWRFHQLLAVLPNRGGEAAQWEHLARHFWSRSGAVLADLNPEDVLGGKELLKGAEPAARGGPLVCSSLWRRAFRLPNSV